VDVQRGSRAGSEALRLPLGPRAAPDPPRSSAWLSVALVVAAIAAAVAPCPFDVPTWARAALAVGLLLLAALVQHALRGRAPPPRGWLLVDGAGIHRVERARTALVDWTAPFGVTVLASADRATLLLAITSPEATRYLSVRVRHAEDAASAPTLIDRATTAADSDLRAQDETALTAADAERLLAEVVRRAPEALDRAFLSDLAGEPIVLERGELRVGPRRIDLAAPLEWRATFFQELGAYTASVCQATWVRQADVELVLVAPMPGDGVWLNEVDAAVRAAGAGGAVQRSVARDLRLMQAAAGDPPPRELRRAIDRLFMLPLRRALDRAPQMPRVPSSSSWTRHERRA